MSKVLMIAHNHPQLSSGGAEILAYSLFDQISKTEGMEAMFLAAVSGTHRQEHGKVGFQALNQSKNEILLSGAQFDHFLQSQKNLSFLSRDFADLLKKFQPEIVHLHHSINLGMEALAVIRQVLPKAKILYTLHEFVLICRRDGQMVRRPSNSLCDSGNPSKCHQCFPEVPVAKFALREAFLKTHLQLVDCFISPSNFLAERFIEWGIPKERMHVIENGIEGVDSAPHRVLKKGGKRNRFAFFGQITPYKGASVMIDAAAQLIADEFTDFHLDIYGDIERQTADFRSSFFDSLQEVRTNVHFHGRYRNTELPELMAKTDWMIIPSTWWENSPLVIQEAVLHRRPVLASNIGGMAEKVINEKTGLHFQVGNPLSLAETMRRGVEESGLWENLVANITDRPTIERSAADHIVFYHSLLS